MQWRKYRVTNRNRIKLLHWEPGGMVICSKMLEGGTFALPDLSSANSSSYSMQWRDLVILGEGIMEKEGSRKNVLYGSLANLTENLLDQ
ncbi:IS66 family insertion sequence element accessory protein TnpB [Bacteroides reticulotermitis]|uniref:IS66 family insertion sequence element accessory protein TnpB n=1 Tax=Bacteroides reticulotermitis TaxID=1133319 RepID=UPI003A85DBE3